MRWIHFPLLLVLTFAATAGSARAAALPGLASRMAGDLDGQLAERLGVHDREARRQYGMVLTTIVSLDNVELASPLSRLLVEELGTQFVDMGYKLQEIRKGRNVLFHPNKGELLLTRRAEQVDSASITSSLMLTGTYTATSKHIRFNVKVIDSSSNEVLAMSSGTLEVSREARELMVDGSGRNFNAVSPKVYTTFASAPDYMRHVPFWEQQRRAAQQQ